MLTQKQIVKRWLELRIKKAAYAKRWRLNNLEYNREYMRGYMSKFYQLHKEKINEKQRIRYKEKKSKVVDTIKK